MAVVTGSTWADRWAQGMAAAQAKMQAGIQAVTEAPTAKAAAQANKYAANTAAAVASGRYQNALNKVSLQQWQQAFVAKISRVGSGATAAKPKAAMIMDQVLPKIYAAAASVKNMPTDTYELRKARAMAYMDALHATSGKP